MGENPRLSYYYYAMILRIYPQVFNIRVEKLEEGLNPDSLVCRKMVLNRWETLSLVRIRAMLLFGFHRILTCKRLVKE